MTCIQRPHVFNVTLWHLIGQFTCIGHSNHWSICVHVLCTVYWREGEEGECVLEMVWHYGRKQNIAMHAFSFILLITRCENGKVGRGTQGKGQNLLPASVPKFRGVQGRTPEVQ